jgi:hypothetical protein
VTGQITDATSSFLEAAASDLQRQIGRTGAVEELRVEQDADGTTVIAAVRINERTLEIRGTGENLLAAYAKLHRNAPESILAARFVDYLER